MADEQVELDDKHLDIVYKSLTTAKEFWIVIGRGMFAFRYGPYTPIEAGKVLSEAVERKLAVTIIGQCGRDMDWQLAEDLGCWLKGHPPRENQEGDMCGECGAKYQKAGEGLSIRHQPECQHYTLSEVTEPEKKPAGQ